MNVQRGRAAFSRCAWMEAYRELVDADRQATLEPADLERLAMASYLIGRYEEQVAIGTRAFHGFLAANDPAGAARVGFWLGFGLLNRGERAHGSGWLARVQRLLEEGGLDCVERGYLLLPAALRSLAEGDAANAHTVFGQAVAIGRRFGDASLVALGRLGRGQALIRLGEAGEGVARLDEVMASVGAGELVPIVVGIVYCAAIESCQEIFDLRRAQEWTELLSRWCETQPDLVPFRGQCLVRRAEVMQQRGDWPDAVLEAERACELLARPPGEPAAGAAFYQRAELYRLRGEYDQAEQAYREASRWGRRTQPGLALLRLAQGRADTAAAQMRSALEEARDPPALARVLPAQVEILLAGGDIGAARTASDELSALAARLDAPLLQALADSARGAVLLADDDAAAALDTLRRAFDGWLELETPYEAARTRVDIAIACRALGDDETAALELDAARSVFEQLGAAPDVARVDRLAAPPTRAERHGLSPRELEVLRFVAAGKTNKAIAAALFLSDRTVERHVSNIFVKLGVSSRSAATAHAYEHGLV